MRKSHKIFFMTLQHDIGKRIRAFRKAQGLNQSDLAKLVGCDQAHISRLEKGHSEGTPTQLYNIAQVLGTTVGILFGELPPDTSENLKQLSHDLDSLSPEARATFEAAIHLLAQSQNIKKAM